MQENSVDLRFLGEEDFLSAMENVVKPWLLEHTKQALFSTADGLKLNYYVVTPENPVASLTLVHGMAEFWGKYNEYVYYLACAGFKVFFLEQRGHGYSEGKAPEHDIIYIDKYSTYVEDLHSFVEAVVIPGSNGLKKLLLAHSMGGAVATLFLEKYPEYFEAALLSSPMFKMKSDNFSNIAVAALSIYCALSSKKKQIAPGQKHFNPQVRLEDGSAKSRPRFEYQLNIRKNDTHYQTTSATLGWAAASLRATRALIRNAEKIKIPVNVMTAGEDHLISPEGYEAFGKKVPQAVFHHYPYSRHEIFNALESTRKKYFTDVLTILHDYAAGNPQ